MIRIALFAAEGCEEIEALTVVDLLRRAGMDIEIVSLTDNKAVTGAHKIVFGAEQKFNDIKIDTYDGIIVPGGMPGTTNVAGHAGVCNAIKKFASEGKLVAAICAAPSVLGELGVLAGLNATCYPGFEKKLKGALISGESVVTDKNIITSRGMGTAIDFALAIITYFADESVAEDIAKSIIYR